MECYSESSELVIHAATWMNLLRIMLGAKKKKKKKLIPIIFFFLQELGVVVVDHHCGILVPQPKTEPQDPAVKVPSPNHWTAREFST